MSRMLCCLEFTGFFDSLIDCSDRTDPNSAGNQAAEAAKKRDYRGGNHLAGTLTATPMFNSLPRLPLENCPL